MTYISLMLALVPSFENWKHFLLQFEYLNFFPIPFGTKPLPWFVLRYWNWSVPFFFFDSPFKERGTQLSQNVMGKKCKMLVKKIFLLFTPCQLSFVVG